jgi:hypothetical protein
MIADSTAVLRTMYLKNTSLERYICTNQLYTSVKKFYSLCHMPTENCCPMTQMLEAVMRLYVPRGRTSVVVTFVCRLSVHACEVSAVGDHLAQICQLKTKQIYNNSYIISIYLIYLSIYLSIYGSTVLCWTLVAFSIS